MKVEAGAHSLVGSSDDRCSHERESKHEGMMRLAKLNIHQSRSVLVVVDSTSVLYVLLVLVIEGVMQRFRVLAKFMLHAKLNVLVFVGCTGAIQRVQRKQMQTDRFGQRRVRGSWRSSIIDGRV